MIAVFEQYLKVASLKETANSVQRELFKRKDEGTAGATVPSIGKDEEENDAEVSKVVDKHESQKDAEVMMQTMDAFIPTESRLQIQDES